MSELDDLKQWLKDTEEEPLEEMTAFFQARLGGYEAHMSHWKKSYERLGLLIPDGVTKLLDLGCGTGLEIDEIFKRHPDISITGIDLSNDMLQVLRGKYTDRKLTLIQGDYFTEPFDEKQYDMVISFETLHHFKPEKKAALFKKIYRCLREGGSYLQADYLADNDEWETLLMTECERRRKRQGIPEDVFVHFDTPLTAEHEIALLREAGFSDVKELEEWDKDEPAMIRAFKKNNEPG